MNIVFDFGAVLFNWQPRLLLRQSFPERVRDDMDAATLAQQMFDHPDWLGFDRGLLGIDDVIERLSSRLGLPRLATTHLVYAIGDHLKPIAETVVLLQALAARRQQGQGVQGLYFLSNMPAPYARFLLAQHAFLKCFDGGVFSSDVQLNKPDPAIYQELQSRYHLAPSTILFIDDVESNVHTARTLGWQGIRFESPQQLRARLVDLALLSG